MNVSYCIDCMEFMRQCKDKEFDLAMNKISMSEGQVSQSHIVTETKRMIFLMEK